MRWARLQKAMGGRRGLARRPPRAAFLARAHRGELAVVCLLAPSIAPPLLPHRQRQLFVRSPLHVPPVQSSQANPPPSSSAGVAVNLGPRDQLRHLSSTQVGLAMAGQQRRLGCIPLFKRIGLTLKMGLVWHRF
jgi:hypothetical protein